MKTLKKNYEFKGVLSRGKGFYGAVLKIYIRPNRKQENRIGIAIQKKIGKAVERNKIKRWIREAYRKTETEIGIGYDIVFLCKNKESVEKMSLEVIQSDIKKILESKT